MEQGAGRYWGKHVPGQKWGKDPEGDLVGPASVAAAGQVGRVLERRASGLVNSCARRVQASSEQRGELTRLGCSRGSVDC